MWSNFLILSYRTADSDSGSGSDGEDSGKDGKVPEEKKATAAEEVDDFGDDFETAKASAPVEETAA